MATIVDELVALLGFRVENEADLKRFNKGLDNLEKKAYAVGASLRNMATVAGVAVAGGIAFLGKGVIDTTAKFETYAATLETIEGSQEKAQKSLAWLSNFAQTTPFEIDELTRAFVKLKAYGIEPTDGTMSTLGDTASAMGKTLNEAVEAFADASTMQFERLKEFGITSSQKGDQVTFSWQQNGKAMTKVVKKNATDIQKFLKDTWGSKFDGAMIRQSKTWKGMMSNLGDSWTNFQRQIGEAGFFDNVKNKLAGLMDLIGRWQTDGTIQKIANTLSSAFTSIADGIGIAFERIAKHIGFLNENWEKARPYIRAVEIALLGLLMVSRPMITALILLAAFVDDFLTYMEGGESVIGNFIDWIKRMLPVSEEVAKAIAGIALAITGGLIAALVLAPASFAGAAAGLIGSLITAIGIAATGAVTLFAAPVATLLSGFVTALTTGFALLSNPVGWAVILAGVAAALVAYFWTDLQNLWNAIDFTSLGTKIGEGIIAGLKAMAGAIAATVAAIVPSVQTPSGMLPVVPMNQQPGAKMGASIGARIGADRTTQTNTTTVNAPVSVQVQQATDAPAAVGGAISGAVNRGAQPSRMQSGPAQ